MSFIDLHTHSTASDGTLTPTELFRAGAAAGLRAVAITDHDTVDGVPEFLAAGSECPETEAVPGVEMAATFSSREMHIVGLFIDPASPALIRFLAERRTDRQKRNEEIRLKLKFLGYPLEWDDPLLAPNYRSGSLGRPHFARALVERYGWSSSAEVFNKLLGHSRPAYVPRRLPDPAAACAAIHAAGGVSVWAHPIYRQRNERALLKRVIRRFAPLGLDAVEAYYSLFGPPETALVSEIAAAFGLARSGGSDFHGANTPQLSIGTGAGGLRVPGELLEELRAKRPGADGAAAL